MKKTLVTLMLALGIAAQSFAAEPEMTPEEQNRIAGIALGVLGAAVIGVAQAAKEDGGCTIGSRTISCTEDNHDEVGAATVAGGVLAVGGLVLFAANLPEAAQFRSDEYGTGIAFSVGGGKSLFFGGTEKHYAAVQYRIEF